MFFFSSAPLQSAVGFGFLFAVQNVPTAYAGTQGFDSMCESVITGDQFNTMKTLKSHKNFVIANYFNGALVTDPNTMEGLELAVNRNGGQSLENAKPYNFMFLDAYHIPYCVESAPMDTDVPGYAGQSNIYAQARKPIDYLNIDCPAPCAGRTWLVVLEGIGQWCSNQTLNALFIKEFFSYFPDPLGPAVGILTHKTDYENLIDLSIVPIKDSNNQKPKLWWHFCNGQPVPIGYQGFGPSRQRWSGPTGSGPYIHRYTCNVNTGVGVQCNYDWGNF